MTDTILKNSLLNPLYPIEAREVFDSENGALRLRGLEYKGISLDQASQIVEQVNRCLKRYDLDYYKRLEGSVHEEIIQWAEKNLGLSDPYLPENPHYRELYLRDKRNAANFARGTHGPNGTDWVHPDDLILERIKLSDVYDAESRRFAIPYMLTGEFVLESVTPHQALVLAKRIDSFCAADGIDNAKNLNEGAALVVKRLAVNGLGLKDPTQFTAASLSTVQIPTELADTVYAVANIMHDRWREPRALAEGGHEPRWKPVKSGAGLEEVMRLALNKHYLDNNSPFSKLARARALRGDPAENAVEIDIANLSNEDLIPKLSNENLIAALGAVQAVLAKPRNDLESLATIIHDQWRGRNGSWAPPELMLDYAQLPEDEKEKDRVVVRVAASEIEKHRLAPLAIAGLHVSQLRGTSFDA